jgi:DNA-binding winged helix-turn-helix (wHTH) protein
MNRCPTCGSIQPDNPIRRLEFYYAEKTVSFMGRSCKLTPKQLDILEHLIDAYPRPVSADLLAAEVWSGIDVKDITVRVHVYQMRKAFRNARLAVSVIPCWGRGYALRLAPEPVTA